MLFNIIRKTINKHKYNERAVITTRGEGASAYRDYYTNLFRDPNFQHSEEDLIVLEEYHYVKTLKNASLTLKTGKALSNDLIPDNLVSK